MKDTSVKTVEREILAMLRTSAQPIDMDGIVQRIRQADERARAVDVKIAAFNLVSRGQVGLNEQWQLSRASAE